MTGYEENTPLPTLYASAKEDYEAGRYQDGLRITKELLMRDFGDVRFWLLEAKLRMAIEDLAGANPAIEQAMQLEPESPEPILLRARLALAEGFFEEALSWCEEAYHWVDSDIVEGDIDLLRAEALLAKVESAVADIRENLEDEDEGPMRSVPITPALEGELEEGLRAARSVPSPHPSYCQALAIAAQLYNMKGEEGAAIESWYDALEIAPNEPLYLRELGQLLESVEEEEEAIAVFRRLFEVDMAAIEASEGEGLLVEPEVFEQMAQEIWDPLFEEWLQDVPFPFEMKIVEHPTHELFEAFSEDEPFDPRLSIHVEFISNLPEPPTVRLLVFQRNVERQVPEGQSEELDLTLEHLLEDTLLKLLAVLSEGNDEMH